MNDAPSERQPTEKIKSTFKLKRREKWSVLVAVVVGLLAVLLWRPINRAVLTVLVLRAEKPAAPVVNELVAQARDPAALLQRLWQTDKIPHRVLAITYLKEHANTDSALLGRLESLLLAAAKDGDLEVRELALQTLAARRHPELPRLAQEQLRDVDPAARVLGLTHLRKAGDARLVPMVVPLMDDPNPLVVVHAALVLRQWTGEDFGVRISQAPGP